MGGATLLKSYILTLLVNAFKHCVLTFRSIDFHRNSVENLPVDIFTDIEDQSLVSLGNAYFEAQVTTTSIDVKTCPAPSPLNFKILP